VLLQGLGHTDFRDARGPMGFTQRQAGGRFTSDEAAELIERLHESEGETDDPVATSAATSAASAAVLLGEKVSDLDRTLRSAPAGKLAAELQRRGWTVSGPNSRLPRATSPPRP